MTKRVENIVNFSVRHQEDISSSTCPENQILSKTDLSHFLFHLSEVVLNCKNQAVVGPRQEYLINKSFHMAPRKIGIYRLFSWNFRNSSMKQWTRPSEVDFEMCATFGIWINTIPFSSPCLKLGNETLCVSVAVTYVNEKKEKKKYVNEPICPWNERFQYSILGAEEVREGGGLPGVRWCRGWPQTVTVRFNTKFDCCTLRTVDQRRNVWNGALVKVQKKNCCSQHQIHSYDTFENSSLRIQHSF